MTEDWEGGTLEESGKLDNPDYRCKHGTFIGDPYGPDYMCEFCEMGTTDEEYEEILKFEARRARRRRWYHNYCNEMVNKIKAKEMDLVEYDRRLHRVALISRRYVRGRYA